MPILSVDGKKFHLSELKAEGSSWTVLVDEKKVTLAILEPTTTGPPGILVRTGGKVFRAAVEKKGERDVYSVELNGKPMIARLEDETPVLHATGLEAAEGPALVTSPMAGKIASVKTAIGATVEEGQALIVLEAMKMENEIAAPKKGIVKEIYVQQGALAKPGDKLVLVE
jgi:biotin carboxyl carrier protein